MISATSPVSQAAAMPAPVAEVSIATAAPTPQEVDRLATTRHTTAPRTTAPHVPTTAALHTTATTLHTTTSPRTTPQTTVTAFRTIVTNGATSTVTAYCNPYIAHGLRGSCPTWYTGPYYGAGTANSPATLPNLVGLVGLVLVVNHWLRG